MGLMITGLAQFMRQLEGLESADRVLAVLIGKSTVGRLPGTEAEAGSRELP